MHPALRVLLLICQLLIIGLGLLMAFNEVYGMAAVFVVFCWSIRPDILRRLGSEAARRIRCAILGHDWRWAGRGLPDSASPADYSKCAQCGRDSRQWWEIEDDTLCRMERMERLYRAEGR